MDPALLNELQRRPASDKAASRGKPGESSGGLHRMMLALAVILPLSFIAGALVSNDDEQSQALEPAQWSGFSQIASGTDLPSFK
jgi:hypothetical protein